MPSTPAPSPMQYSPILSIVRLLVVFPWHRRVVLTDRNTERRKTTRSKASLYDHRTVKGKVRAPMPATEINARCEHRCKMAVRTPMQTAMGRNDNGRIYTIIMCCVLFLLWCFCCEECCFCVVFLCVLGGNATLLHCCHMKQTCYNVTFLHVCYM